MYKVVQIWPGLFVCKQVTVCPGHIWTTLYITHFLWLIHSIKKKKYFSQVHELQHDQTNCAAFEREFRTSSGQVSEREQWWNHVQDVWLRLRQFSLQGQLCLLGGGFLIVNVRWEFLFLKYFVKYTGTCIERQIRNDMKFVFSLLCAQRGYGTQMNEHLWHCGKCHSCHLRVN
jgi:hypothetical protein